MIPAGTCSFPSGSTSALTANLPVEGTEGYSLQHQQNAEYCGAGRQSINAFHQYLSTSRRKASRYGSWYISSYVGVHGPVIVIISINTEVACTKQHRAHRYLTLHHQTWLSALEFRSRCSFPWLDVDTAATRYEASKAHHHSTGSIDAMLQAIPTTLSTVPPAQQTRGGIPACDHEVKNHVS